jgi:hypothetical protein
MDKNLKVGQIAYAIYTGYGMERIVKVKLLKEEFKDGKVVGYDVNLVNDYGNLLMFTEFIFNTEKEALEYRETMLNKEMDDFRKRTDTPEKMLEYLLGTIYTDMDGYIDCAVKEDFVKRVKEVMNIK